MLAGCHDGSHPLSFAPEAAAGEILMPVVIQSLNARTTHPILHACGGIMPTRRAALLWVILAGAPWLMSDLSRRLKNLFTAFIDSKTRRVQRQVPGVPGDACELRLWWKRRAPRQSGTGRWTNWLLEARTHSLFGDIYLSISAQIWRAGGMVNFHTPRGASIPGFMVRDRADPPKLGESL